MKAMLRIPALACLILLASACVTTSQTPQVTPPEVRAAQRWAALIERDAATAYAYFTPAYRTVNGLAAFETQVTHARTNWTSAEVTSHDCPEVDRCVVRVKIGFELVNLLPGVARHTSSQTVDETWLMLDGQWYFLPAK